MEVLDLFPHMIRILMGFYQKKTVRRAKQEEEGKTFSRLR
jgi:hypothetical protein